MKNSPHHFSPQAYARMGGVLYLMIIAAGLFAEAFVRDRFIVPADAAARAANIKAYEVMFRNVKRRRALGELAEHRCDA